MKLSWKNGLLFWDTIYVDILIDAFPTIRSRGRAIYWQKYS